MRSRCRLACAAPPNLRFLRFFSCFLCSRILLQLFAQDDTGNLHRSGVAATGKLRLLCFPAPRPAFPPVHLTFQPVRTSVVMIFKAAAKSRIHTSDEGPGRVRPCPLFSTISSFICRYRSNSRYALNPLRVTRQEFSDSRLLKTFLLLCVDVKGTTLLITIRRRLALLLKTGCLVGVRQGLRRRTVKAVPPLSRYQLRGQDVTSPLAGVLACRSSNATERRAPICSLSSSVGRTAGVSIKAPGVQHLDQTVNLRPFHSSHALEHRSRGIQRPLTPTAEGPASLNSSFLSYKYLSLLIG